MAKILIIDDEKNIRRTLHLSLEGMGHRTIEAANAEDGLSLLEQSPVDLVLLDVRLPGMDGLAALRSIAETRPGQPVIMMSGQATVAVAVEATRAGALDFLEKPIDRERLLLAVRNALVLGRLGRKVADLEQAEAHRRLLVGGSSALEAVRRMVMKVAPTTATVLVTGESGTGKELVARAIHEASPRRDAPFVKVNCAAIPDDLIESELFGAVKGAYTGADRTRDGRFLLADGGTLLLDEIGDMGLRVQAKVLRVLQEGELERVGDPRTVSVDVRVIAATNKDLKKEVEAGRFREDLYFRLHVVPIAVPPLRDRREDVPDLCQHFLDRYARENGASPIRMSGAALSRLSALPFPGNVRELGNLIERLAIFSEGGQITDRDVAEHAGDPPPASTRLTERSASTRALEQGDPASTGPAWQGDPAPAPLLSPPDPELIQRLGGLIEARREFEKLCIEHCLDRTGGNVSETARLLNIERSNLHKKMQALGIEARPPRRTNVD